MFWLTSLCHSVLCTYVGSSYDNVKAWFSNVSCAGYRRNTERYPLRYHGIAVSNGPRSSSTGTKITGGLGTLAHILGSAGF